MTEWRAAVAAARPSTIPEPEPPAAGPVRRSEKNAQLSALGSESFREHGSQPSEGRPKIDVDDSLRLLAWPPRSLRTKSLRSQTGANPETAWSSPASARLTKEEVVDLADAAARAHGYDLSEYQRAEPHYDWADGAWSLLYDQEPAAGTTEIAKHFSVAVDDKTKRTVLVGK